MAKESSFDVVSQVDLQEVDNAYGQAKKEIAQRYDLKGSGAEVSFDKNAKTLTVSAPSDFVCTQVKDVLIDSCGAVIGMLVIYGISHPVQYFIDKKKSNGDN